MIAFCASAEAAANALLKAERTARFSWCDDLAAEIKYRLRSRAGVQLSEAMQQPSPEQPRLEETSAKCHKSSGMHRNPALACKESRTAIKASIPSCPLTASNISMYLLKSPFSFWLRNRFVSILERCRQYEEASLRHVSKSMVIQKRLDE